MIFSHNFSKTTEGISGSDYIKYKFKIKNKCSRLVGATSKNVINCQI